MRPCPVCNEYPRTLVWSMDYKIPDGWPLPRRIDWHQCDQCGMLYGDGDFDQDLLNRYYRDFYGYGVNSAQVSERLEGIAAEVMQLYPYGGKFVDFGGSGDDGKSIACEYLKAHNWPGEAINLNAGDVMPDKVDVLLASHVFEHIYDMSDALWDISISMRPDGLLIVDGPEATGLVREWGFPMLDFHTKHINHFRTIDYLRMMERAGWTLTDFSSYVDVRSQQRAKSVRLYFRQYDIAEESDLHILREIGSRVAKLFALNCPVNVWGLGDISWHLLARVPSLQVLDYIDNDPAYRNATYGGKPVLERPTNDAPIVILAQGQREKLIANIRKMGVTNQLIEI